MIVRLQAAFRAAGCDPDRLTLDEIAGIDQLHLGGRAASRSLAALGELRPGERILDVGCGTGGASRLLAAEYGCTVVGVDITAAFVSAAERLSVATGLAEQNRFLCADAARIPLAGGAFDVIWCQHALMNMSHLPAVLAEWRRLLAPGGRVLLHEVVAGDNPEPLALPVPWARTAATSHLKRREALEVSLAAAGFGPVCVHDVTETALAWRQKHGRREAGDAPARRLPGPALIFGEEFVEMGRNLAGNLAAGRVRILEGVWRRTD
ncbi:methyltransferase domain-containing protein [Halomonas sp. BM-2019]|uniref:SAM-dependent methyltransferase n=1 Tax=Halomonas sp. BM-2019 TaxID=2811227 RepID=UPI001B3C1CBD|nr:MAG: methyltransferase domain-containing protein [Halomonas sp. BM-2019]